MKDSVGMKILDREEIKTICRLSRMLPVEVCFLLAGNISVVSGTLYSNDENTEIKVKLNESSTVAFHADDIQYVKVVVNYRRIASYRLVLEGVKEVEERIIEL